MGYAITLLLFIFPVACLSQENNSFQVKLMHVDSKSNFTQLELLNRAAARSANRLSRLMGMQLFSSANISSTVHSPSGDSIGEYFMDLAILGTLLSLIRQLLIQAVTLYGHSALLAKDVYTNQHQYMILQNPPPFHRYHVTAQHINYCAVLITLLHLAYVPTIIHMAQDGQVEL